MKLIYAYSRIRKGNKMVERTMTTVDGKLRVIQREIAIKESQIDRLAVEEVELEIPAFMNRGNSRRSLRREVK